MQNRNGLSRSIPADVKRAVRQRDGFGCIVCGKAIYDYEHFDPEFADATQHDPAGIILLCISCHRKKTRGFLSNQTIAAARQNPKCKEKGFSFEEFDIGTTAPEISIGDFNATDVDTLIEIFGTKILSISPPAEAHLPFTINALLTDSDGNTILRKVDNEWQSSVENWDGKLPQPRERLAFRALRDQHALVGVDLDAAADQAISACAGNALKTVNRLIAANDFLGPRAAVSIEYSRGQPPQVGELKDALRGRACSFLLLFFQISP